MEGICEFVGLPRSCFGTKKKVIGELNIHVDDFPAAKPEQIH